MKIKGCLGTGCITLIIVGTVLVSTLQLRVGLDIGMALGIIFGISVLVVYFHYRKKNQAETLDAIRRLTDIPEADIQISRSMQKDITLLNQDILAFSGEGSRRELVRYEGTLQDIRLEGGTLIGHYNVRFEDGYSKREVEYKPTERAWGPHNMNPQPTEPKRI